MLLRKVLLVLPHILCSLQELMSECSEDEWCELLAAEVPQEMRESAEFQASLEAAMQKAMDEPLS
jgi:hypothetical protein